MFTGSGAGALHDERYLKMSKKIRESVVPFAALLVLFLFLSWLIVSPLGRPLLWSVVLSYFAYPLYKNLHNNFFSGRLTNIAAGITTNGTEKLPLWIDEDEYEENGERDEHETYIIHGVQSSYTLDELACHLDLEPYEQAKAVNDEGFGRNCTLFDELRHIAYKLPDKSYRAVESHLKGIADDINNRFDVPLLYNEVKHIIKSIARYCSKKDFTESHKRFSELQAYRGAKGGKAKGDAYEEQKQLAIELHEKGMKKKDIAEKVGVTPRTLTNWGLRKKK